MQPFRTTPSATLARTVIVGALAVTVLAASGCGWFRKGDKLYAGSPESRPLEVPPDLDRPDTAGAMAMPAAPASVSRSSMTPAPQQAAAASATGFTVAMERDVVFARVGEVLAGTAGATVVSKAEILGTYDVDYEGSKFLVRVTRVDGGTYVSAVDPRGLPAAGEAPTRLVASLRSALGG
jgi:uncharacterized lipoprotein